MNQQQLIRDHMTKNPVVLTIHDTIQQAALQMRERNIGDVLVRDNSGKVRGIVTDRDIVVRAVADAKSSRQTRLGECCSENLASLTPNDSVDDALRMMRDLSIRRIPVVDDGKAVGIVTLSDLARLRDPKSVLAKVSAPRPIL